MSTTQNTATVPATQSTMEASVPVTIRSLMDAGAHYGHQTQRWNPKMLPYIYGARNGVHIINLDITLKKWEIARKYIVDRVALGGNVLFVGTKLQAKDIIKEEALRSGAFYVASRWLGGCLSNFQTMKKSIERMRKLENLLAEANEENSKVRLHKKERLDISRQVEKLEANLGGLSRSLLDILQALLTKNLNRLIDRSFGLVQSAFAIHHSRAGHLAQLLDHLTGNL